MDKYWDLEFQRKLNDSSYQPETTCSYCFKPIRGERVFTTLVKYGQEYMFHNRECAQHYLHERTLHKKWFDLWEWGGE